MKRKSDITPISPDFSRDIAQLHAESFFERGFGAVKRILFMFVVFFIMIVVVAVIFTYFFSINRAVSGMGALEPENYQEVKVNLNSVIDDFMVRPGDEVRKGQLIARLSDFEYKISLVQVEKDLEAAKAELKQKIEINKLPLTDFNRIAEYSKVRAKASGIVERVAVRSGQAVRAGDLLCKLSDFDYQIQLSQAEKDQEAAKAELNKRIEKYKLSYAIYKNYIQGLPTKNISRTIPEIAVQQAIVEKLAKQVALLNRRIEETRIVSPCDGIVLTHDIKSLLGQRVMEGEVVVAVGKLYTKEADGFKKQKGAISLPEIEMQTALIEKTQKQVDLLKDKCNKSRIYAPMSGIVVTPDLDKKIGAPINKGETLLVIADPDKWIVKTMVLEKHIPKIRVGDSAKAKINAFPFMEFKMFKGKVKEIAQTPTQVKNQALLSKDEDDEPVTSSFYFTVTVELDDRKVVNKNQIHEFQFGLLADVDIIIDKTKIISYLAKIFLGKLEVFGDLTR